MTEDFELIEVALFPIPNVVTFPGVDLPLHVFEPRYRQLVHDCVEENRLLGVCHTQKAIHKPSGQAQNKEATPENLQKMLNSNQTTYKPHSVFSAGPCEILETLPDGRLLANVETNQRFELIDERQSLPYRIVRCRELPDLDSQPDTKNSATDAYADRSDQALQQSLHQRFIELVKTDNEELALDLKSAAWSELTASDYSFRIFQCLRFDADVMQSILEMRSARERLTALSQLLQI